MRKTCIWILIALMSNSLLMAANHQSITGKRALYTHTRSTKHNISKEAPSYTFVQPPTNLLSSYYDYMIGSYNNIPMKEIPDALGGGYIVTFHGQRTFTGLRRVFHAVISNNGVVDPMTELSTAQIREGYPALDIDKVSGFPIFAWHSDIDPTDSELEVMYNYETFMDLIYPLLSQPSIVIDNPITLTAPNSTITNDNEFIWPSVEIGTSPTPGMRRVYILGRNAAVHSMNASENPYITYADFNTEQLEAGYPLSWNYIHIPELDSWNCDTSTWRRPSYALVIGNDDKIFLVGHHSAVDMVTDEEIIEPDLDVFIGSNYGLGTWQHYSASSTLSAWNPADQNGVLYFTDSENNPVQLQWVWGESSNTNAVIDANGLIHMPGLWQLVSTDLSFWFPEFNSIKEMVFDTNSRQFSNREVYPVAGTSADSIFWQPWDTDGNHVVDSYDPETGNPILWRDWNFCYWDETAVDSGMEANYNFFKMTEPNELGWMACVWENSWRSRAFNADNDPQYSPYANCPEIFIAVSSDYGQNWKEPIKLNSIETPQLTDIIPMFAYPSDQLKIINDGSGHDIGRLGLLFFDDNTWGAGSINPPVGINDGGNVDFSIIDIDLGPSTPIQSGISGYVNRSDDTTPIEGAFISTGSSSAITDENGFYSLVLAPGSYVVTAVALGFQTQVIAGVIVQPAHFTTLGIELVSVIFPVGEVSVIAESDNNSVLVSWLPPDSKKPESLERSSRSTRDCELTGFLVFRFRSSYENDESHWTFIGEVTETSHSLTDSSWKDLGEGLYEYAVKAVYSNQFASPPSFSRVINRRVYASLNGYVRDVIGNPINGAHIILYDMNHSIVAQAPTIESGYYVCTYIHYGHYLLHCSADTYQAVPAISIDLAAAQNQQHDFVLSDSLYLPRSVTAEVDQVHLVASVTWLYPENNNSRTLLGYKVWRMSEDNIDTPTAWELLTPLTQATAYYDTDWINMTPGKYLYGIQAIYAGNSLSQTARSNFVVMPGKTRIISIAPNPFRDTAMIHFMLQRDTETRFDVFNLKGQHVRTIKAMDTQIGENDVIWDGNDDKGDSCPTGIYFCKMNSKGRTDSVKLLRIK